MKAERIVVVDVETTGFGAYDRVVEVAAVVLDASTLEEVDTFETLVNPGRGVGPTSVHGITKEMVADAPTFAEIAGALSDHLHGAVLVAHNLSFDHRMLDQEFRKVGAELAGEDGICTYRLTRKKLDAACAHHGIELDDHHRALADARAAAELLRRVGHDGAATPAAVAKPPRTRTARLVTRDDLAGG